MTARTTRLAWRRRLTLSLAVWTALALLAWLDAHGVDQVQQANIWKFVVDGLGYIWQGLRAAGPFIADTAIRALQHLGASLSWVAEHLADFIRSSGAVFARVWDWAKTFYYDIVKPALYWLHDWYLRIRDWLTKYLGPIFRFLERVRKELRRIWNCYVRPILDIIDQTRAVLRVLGHLGIDWARKLDRVLGDIESVVIENYVLVTSKLNEITDLFADLVTPGRLFQRLPFVRSLDRDAGHWIRIFWNRQVVGYSAAEAAGRAAREYDRADPVETGRQLGEFYRTGGGELAGIIDELVPTWQEAAGLSV